MFSLKIKEENQISEFIKKFYYGNLNPQARNTKENKTVKKIEILMLNDDFLTENLSSESKKKFLDFCNRESSLDSFIMGFRLGTQFTYDVFVNDKAPFKNLMKEV